MAIKKILILGGTGMLGHTLFTHLSKNSNYDVRATARSERNLRQFPEELRTRIRPDVDANNFDTIVRAIASIHPDIVINCIGIIKQLWQASDPLSAITVNSQLPHRISLLCSATKVKLIHISTDCVFSGKRGCYKEHDTPDADDLYGRTKLLGEVSYPHCLTLRTSIIGHEKKGFHGLVEWFLKQKEPIRGYTKAIFSGFPTIELATILSDFVLSNPSLQGVYHVSSEPISKYDLLSMIAEKYGKPIKIEPYDDYQIDRSLDSDRFKKTTGYTPPPWLELVDRMYSHFKTSPIYSFPAD